MSRQIYNIVFIYISYDHSLDMHTYVCFGGLDKTFWSHKKKACSTCCIQVEVFLQKAVEELIRTVRMRRKHSCSVVSGTASEGDSHITHWSPIKIKLTTLTADHHQTSRKSNPLFGLADYSLTHRTSSSVTHQKYCGRHDPSHQKTILLNTIQLLNTKRSTSY